MARQVNPLHRLGALASKHYQPKSNNIRKLQLYIQQLEKDQFKNKDEHSR